MTQLNGSSDKQAPLVTSLCEALELGSICKGVLQTWARESQFMRLATLFAFSAAAVSALTSGGKEATT